jgi:hypothetical protein
MIFAGKKKIFYTRFIYTKLLRCLLYLISLLLVTCYMLFILLISKSVVSAFQLTMLELSPLAVYKFNWHLFLPRQGTLRGFMSPIQFFASSICAEKSKKISLG